MISKIKIKGSTSLYENTSIQFTPIGMYIRVSVNISPELIPFLSPNNVEKGETHWVYCLKHHIESKNICDISFKHVQETLLNRCMISVRKAKQQLLQKEINVLSLKN